jgi:hypothetical protein
VPTVIREGDVTKIKMKVTIENNSRGQKRHPRHDSREPARHQQAEGADRGPRQGRGATRHRRRDDQPGRRRNSQDTALRRHPRARWLFKTTASQNTGRELVVFITPSVLKLDLAQAPPPAVRDAEAGNDGELFPLLVTRAARDEVRASPTPVSPA